MVPSVAPCIGSRGADLPCALARAREKARELEPGLVWLAWRVGHELGVEWEPLEAKRELRLRALTGALLAGAGERELELAAIGMGAQRAMNIRRAMHAGRWDPFWELADGDPVARVARHRRRRSLEQLGRRLEELVERPLRDFRPYLVACAGDRV